MKAKIIIMMSVLIIQTGCVVIGKDELGLDVTKPVSEKDYWKIPCFWSGQTLIPNKKKQ